MSNLRKMFEELKSKDDKALVTYITAGDPDLETTRKLLFTLSDSGADVIEIGVPFSDPMADGPTIQRASLRSLENGTNLKSILDMVADIRSEIKVPLILFGYYNPIFSFGLRDFAKGAKDAGIDGLIIVDMPPEESKEIRRYTDKKEIDFINLISPVTDGERLEEIVADATGFLYYVSVTGVTGARKTLPEEIGNRIAEIKKLTGLPVVVGFGISDPETARSLGRVSDGVVVGSALVNIIEKHGDNEEVLLKRVKEFVSSIKEGVNN